ncbi:uncharacterized protein METZ01_LOCUS212968 [marine metagenome]|uniref:Uncharacterized protein n=1 Tax=marine metagenome TaxID=408172 RepID=A0A382FCT7_9ZZZZ
MAARKCACLGSSGVGRANPRSLNAALLLEVHRSLIKQDLEGDLALVLEVVRQIDRGHAALAQLSFDGVKAVQGLI